MKDMKFLRNNKRAINLAHVINIAVSDNYLVLTTIDGREEKFIYGTEDILEFLMEEIFEFISDDETVLDCELRICPARLKSMGVIE